jgi:hypothetical protein
MKNLHLYLQRRKIYLWCYRKHSLVADVYACYSKHKETWVLKIDNMKLVDPTFSEQEYTDIHNLAGCNYSEKIALYLDVDKKAFGMYGQRKWSK